MKKILAAGATALVLLSCNVAGAAFIDSGTYLTDTTSGLDWLDVTATRGRSYNDVSSRLGLGGLFEGWRYATGLEFNGLISNWAGTPVSAYDYVFHPPAGQGSIDGLAEMLTSTVDEWSLQHYSVVPCIPDDHWLNYCAQTAYGWLSDVGSGGHWLAAILNYPFPPQWISADATAAHFWSEPSGDFAIYPYGSYLVRNVPGGPTIAVPNGTGGVPEPSSIALLGLGLAGLGLSRRRVKAKNLS